MDTTRYLDWLPFDGPATYQIRVQGRIDQVWSDRLEGMLISSHIPAYGPAVTTLIGQVTDQAAVVGVLNTLYELHLPLISVEWLTAE